MSLVEIVKPMEKKEKKKAAGVAHAVQGTEVAVVAGLEDGLQVGGLAPSAGSIVNDFDLNFFEKSKLGVVHADEIFDLGFHDRYQEASHM